MFEVEPTRVALPPRTAPVRFGTFALDLDGCSLFSGDGGVVALTRSEFALLREFVHHPARVLSRDYLLDALAGKRAEPFDRSIDVLVGRLRRKIESDPRKPRLIVTVPAHGYRFDGQPKKGQSAATAEAQATEAQANDPPIVSKDDEALAGGRVEIKAVHSDAGPPRYSIVVLPFANMSGDAEQDYFVEGVTEGLTTDLSRIDGSLVIGRNRAPIFKGKPVDLRQIGRELNVRYVLEGSIQRSGNRMRISVQLLDAENGKHLWSERFDKPVADLFDMQDEIVSRVVNALYSELVVAEARRAERSPKPDSVDLCFQARASWYKGFTPDNLAAARRLYGRALALDPLNVWALVGIAFVDTTVAVNLFPDNRAARLAAAEASATKAVSLAPEHSVAHLCLGFIQIWTHRPREGIRECQRALEMNRSLADAHGQTGVAKIFLGQAEDTEAHIQEALRLSPRDTFVYCWYTFAGTAKIHLGQDEDAVVWLRRSIETNRNHPNSHFYLAAALAHLGRLPEAAFEAQAGLAINPNCTIARIRRDALSNNPVYLAQRERYLDGLRKAGLPEQ